jgi:hypothetical protein
MANKNFTDFNYQGEPSASDFVVGYNEAGTAEQRTTVKDLLSTGLAAYDIFVSPDSIALSGAPTSVEGLVVKNGNNIVAQYSDIASQKNIILRSGLSASTLFGVGNSAGFFYSGLGFSSGKAGTSINGVQNYVNSGYTDVNGAVNFVYTDLGRVSGLGNVLGTESGSVEGEINTVGRPFTITRMLSASNTIFVHTTFSDDPDGWYFQPGQFIQIDGIINSMQNATQQRGSSRFTVVSSDYIESSITVVEPIKVMPGYLDDQPFIDQRYVVGVHRDGNQPALSFAGAHAEGIGNTVIGRAGHVEGEANVVTGSHAHAENFGNCANFASHAEGTENRAGYGIMYFDSYNASTRTFQLFTNHLSTYNTYDVANLVPNSSNLFFISASAAVGTRRNLTRFIVLSANPTLQTVTALSAVYPVDIPSNGTSSLLRSRQLLLPIGSTYAHAEGSWNNARGFGSHAEGINTIAQGAYSHAAGVNATAKQPFTYIWSSNDGVSASNSRPNTQTTRTGQYMVSAHGGMFIPGKVGIGTDSMDNALTVVGTISTNAHQTSQQWAGAYTTLNSISSIIPNPATTIATTLLAGTTALSSINLYNTSIAQLLYTVPAGKTFLAEDCIIIIDSVLGGNVTDTSLPTFRLYRHDTLTNAANQVTNSLTPVTASGNTFTINRYYRIGGSVTALNGKALVSGDDASPQNKIWFRVDSLGTNTYTGISGRAFVSGFLI